MPGGASRMDPHRAVPMSQPLPGGAGWHGQVGWFAEEMPSGGLAMEGSGMSCSWPRRGHGMQVSVEELLSGSWDHEGGRQLYFSC